MSPLFLDTGYDTNSPSSMSAEENHSNNAGSEKEGEEQQVGNRGTKRQAKNRDAARKSRRKQTERADELHEELQSLEQSNSALQKEIASLKKDLHLYTTVLERHKPFCTLKASSYSSTTDLSISPSTDRQTGSSPLQASSSTRASAPSLSTSLTSSLDLQTHECIGSSHLSSPSLAPGNTSLDSPAASSSQLFTPRSSKTVPHPVAPSVVPSPLSLFSETPPSLITSRMTKATPICTSLLSSPVRSIPVSTSVQPDSGQHSIHESSSFSTSGFSTQPPYALDAPQTKQASFQSLLSNAVPPYSPTVSGNTGQTSPGCPMTLPQLNQGNFMRNAVNPSPIYSLSSALQEPASQSLSVSPQVNLELSAAFTIKPSYSQHITPNPSPRLSQLTVPSPLNVPQNNSSSLEGLPSQPSPLHQTLGDFSVDFSLSELLEVNDWILQ